MRFKAPGPTDPGGYFKKMEELQGRSIQVAIRGVPVHQGIKGNEPADWAAKKRLYGDQSGPVRGNRSRGHVQHGWLQG
jgi:ribonuclease HI